MPPSRSYATLAIVLASGCAALQNEPPVVTIPRATVEPNAPPTPQPRWETTIEPALARLAPALQVVIRRAFARGIGSAPNGSHDGGVNDCNTPVRSSDLEPTGGVVAGCGAALWVDGKGAPRAYREASAVGFAEGGVAWLALDPARPNEQTLFLSPDAPGASISLLSPRESIVWHDQRGASFVSAIGQEDGTSLRWVAGTIGAPGGALARPLFESGSTARYIMAPTLFYNAPFALSSDGSWLLDLRNPRGILRDMRTDKLLRLPAACAGNLRFFDFEPVMGRFHVAVSTCGQMFFGEVRHCQLDRSGNLISARLLSPLPGSGCIGQSHYACSVSLDAVLLGGLVLSVHEDTGMGSMPSHLIDARTGQEIELIYARRSPDRIEGISNKDTFVTLRSEGGRLVRKEERLTEEREASLRREVEGEKPTLKFAYCVVSGVPIPEALCPPEEAFRR